MDKLAIVILNWNGVRMLQKYLPTVLQYSRDEATVYMVESNFQRSSILPSEKAFAYKMRLDAMKRQAGRP